MGILRPSIPENLINTQYYDIFSIMQVRNTTIIIGLIWATIFWTVDLAADEYSQLPGVMHVHSKFSSGRHSIEELVSKARAQNLEVLMLTDHDRVVMEYGLFPLRNLIKKREERNSILQIGPKVYLSEIERLNRSQQAVLVIAGVQSSPFYYWTGSPFKTGLTAHDYRKELLLIGLSAPGDYSGLPQLHANVSFRYVGDLLPRFLLFFAVFLLSLYLVRQKGKVRFGGIAIALLSAALMINHHPFKGSRYSPYHGDQGIAPYQEVIDYTKERGGLVFWAHPESSYSKNGVKLGPIRMITKPYADDLTASRNYTGFAAIYGDNSSAANPGMHWDQILISYCRGSRVEPVWAIAGADFHEEKNGIGLDSYQTVFLVKNKRRRDVLAALDRGRFYAVRKSKTGRLKLEHFQIKDKLTGKTGILGEELDIKGRPAIIGQLSSLDGVRQSITVTIIRGGEVAWTLEGQTPLEFHLTDPDEWGGKSYYRLDVKSKTDGYLLSNPIFVTRDSS